MSTMIHLGVPVIDHGSTMVTSSSPAAYAGGPVSLLRCDRHEHHQRSDRTHRRCRRWQIRGRRPGGGPGLGANAARFEGRTVVRARARRLVVRPAAGRGPEHAAQLRGRDPAPHGRLCRARRRAPWPSHRARARPWSCRQTPSRWSAGSTTPTATRSRPSATPSSTCARCRTCACAPTPSAPSPVSVTALAQAIHRYFHEHGFYWIHTPIITASDAEGAGEMFRVSTLDLANLPRTPEGAVDFSQDFFGRPTFLTVSGQLNVESYCLAMTKVYTFGPTFRAENSNTSRHLVGVLDGGAGDRLRRPLGRRRPRRGPAQVRLPCRPRRARGRHGLLRRAHRPRGRRRDWRPSSSPTSSA